MIVTGPHPAAEAETYPARPYRVLPASPDALAAPLGRSALLAVGYGDALKPSLPDPRRITVPLPLLHGARDGEIWDSRHPVQHEDRGLCRLACDGEVMMVQLMLPASDLAADPERAAERLYGELLRQAAQRGYPYLLRIWNFIGDILDGEGDDERYRRFCTGRHTAFSARPQFERSLPAATAIGTDGGGLIIIALAGRRPGVQIENPNQLSAYRYPRVYGPRSPSFARATLLPWADGAELLVSGTASIVGHASVHAGDLAGQLRQIMLNLQTLVSQPGLARHGLLPEQFTVYLRHREDLPALLSLLPVYFGSVPLQILLGDLCRPELLLEVEAIYRSRSPDRADLNAGR